MGTIQFRHRNSVATLAICIVLAAFLPLSVHAQDKPADRPDLGQLTQELLNNVKGKDRLPFSEKFLEVFRDPQASDQDKATALYWRMRVATEQAVYSHDASALPLAEEAYELFMKNFAGTHANQDGYMDGFYALVLQTYVKNGQTDRLADAVAAAEGLRKHEAVTAAVRPGVTDMMIGQAYAIAGEHEKAIAAFGKSLAAGGQGEPFAYEGLIDSLLELKRYDEAMETVGRAMDAYPQGSLAAGFADKLVACIRLGDLDEAVIFRFFPKVVSSPKAIESILVELISRKSQAGETEAALAYAKLCYDVAPIDQIDTSVGWIARCLKILDMDVTRALAFVEFQKHGQAGPDGQIGTEDDIEAPLSALESPLPQAVRQHIETELAKMLPTAGNIYACLRDRGTVYLCLGQYPEALSSFQAAYAAATIAQIKEGSALVPRALKAMDGTVVRANRYLVYQRFGPAGEDGKTGTADDLRDPLEAETFPGLPADVTEALAALAKTPGATVDVYETRGQAFLALGDCKQGFNQMKNAYAMAGDARSLTRAIEDMAGAIKAFDGHIVRANEYLDFQRCGTAGPDGAAGTEDDLTNPIPQITKDIQAAGD